MIDAPEYRHADPPPDEIAVCARCRRGILHRGWCYTCGARGDGLQYVLSPTATDAAAGPSASRAAHVEA